MPAILVPSPSITFSKNESLPRKPGVFMLLMLLLIVFRLCEKPNRPDTLLYNACMMPGTVILLRA